MKYQYLKGYAEALLGPGVNITEDLPENPAQASTCELTAPLGRTIMGKGSILQVAREKIFSQLKDPEVLATLKTAKPKSKRETLAEFLYADVMKQTGDIPRPWPKESQAYFLSLAGQTIDLLGVEEREDVRPSIGASVPYAKAREDMDKHPEARYSPTTGEGGRSPGITYYVENGSLGCGHLVDPKDPIPPTWIRKA